MNLSFKKQFKQPILDGTKIHTFREDPHKRWKPGVKIHMATGVRTMNYDCFNDKETCKSVQEVKLTKTRSGAVMIFIDNSAIVLKLSWKHEWTDCAIKIAKNDGFEHPLYFVEFFIAPGDTGEWTGRLIHWTDLKY